jgi:hypothetical protein
MDLHDVGMLQAGDRLGLPAEAGQFLRSSVPPCEDNLESDKAVEGDVSGAVDDAHPSSAQFAEDLVTGHLERNRG